MTDASPEAPPEIVVVDDDPLFLETVVGNLGDAGLQVKGLVGPVKALDYFQHGGTAAVLLLDWQMPEMDGPDLLQKLRADGVTAPALFLTGLTQPIFEERGLKLGAVDFIEKSKSFAIILQRVKLVLNGVKSPGGAEPKALVESFGSLELHHDSARALWRTHVVPLTLSEFRVVALLAGKGGGDVAYRGIYDVVRGEGFRAGSGEEGYRANVRALIKRIRQKFREVDPDFAALDNYAGFGYRWIENT